VAADRALTHGGDLRSALARNHALMQVGHAVAAGALEEEWQHSVQQTSQPAQHHSQAETAGRDQVLKIGFADRFGVFSKKPVHVHGPRD